MGLTPQEREALDNWLKHGETNKWALVAMNCLVMLTAVGFCVLLAAYLIIVHEVNVFELETWKDPGRVVQQIWRDLQRAAVGLKPATRPSMQQPTPAPFHSAIDEL